MRGGEDTKILQEFAKAGGSHGQRGVSSVIELDVIAPRDDDLETRGDGEDIGNVRCGMSDGNDSGDPRLTVLLDPLHSRLCRVRAPFR